MKIGSMNWKVEYNYIMFRLTGKRLIGFIMACMENDSDCQDPLPQ